MALQNFTAVDPLGQPVPITAPGTAFFTNAPLPANGVVDSGWIKTDNFGGLLYVLRSDVPGSTGGVVVEYSDDAINPIPGGAAISYTQVGMQIQRVLVPKGKWTRISYKNNGTAQANFRFEIKLSTTLIQPTETSLNVHNTDSVLGMVVKADIEARDNAGSYDQIHRTDNSLNVNQTNQPTDYAKTSDIQALQASMANASSEGMAQMSAAIAQVLGAIPMPDNSSLATSANIASVVVAIQNIAFPTTDVTDLAKDATLKDGSQTTQVSNLPDDYATDAAVQAVVTAINGIPSTDVGALAKTTDITALSAVIVQSLVQTLSVNVANFPASPTSFAVNNLPDIQKVTLTNPATATDVSALAKDATLKDGSQKVQVTNFPTAPTAYSITNFPAVQPVSGNIGITGSVEIANDSGNPIPVSGSIAISNLPATQPISGTVTVGNFPATQPISGTVNANVTFPTTQAISGSVSVSNLPATQPISASALPLPAGAATSAKQDTGNTSLASLDGKIPAIGQKASAGSIPVVLPSDQGPLSVTGTFYQSTQPVSAATWPLPTGSSTAALQTSGNASLTSIDSKTPSLGQKSMANSSPVVLATDQSALPVTGTFFQATQPVSGTISVSNLPSTQAVSGTVNIGNLPTTQAVSGTVTANVTFPATQPVSIASLPLPTGGATSANQSTEIASLNNIDTDLGAPGDTAITDFTANGSVIALLKGVLRALLPSSTTTVTTVATLATLTPVLAANPLRKAYDAFSFTGTILVKDGANASATSFSRRLITNGESYPPIAYNGVVTAIGAGTLIITEYF